jgi:transposase
MEFAMTTATTTATAGTILAIDLGRHNSVACAYDRQTRTAAFHSLDTDRRGVDRLFARYPDAVVIIEACGNAGWIRDRAAERGLSVKVANTATEAWRFTHLKRKTDRDDARRLAELEALGQLPTVALPDAATRQRRALIAYRQALIGLRVAAQNRIRGLFAAQGLPSPRGHRAWTAVGLAGLDREARPLEECEPAELWRGMLSMALAEYRHQTTQIGAAEAALDRLATADPATRLLETAPGIGPRTAEAVAAHLHDPTRFASGKQVSAYAGLVPRQYQSGESDRKGRITCRGPGILRKLLVECAWASLRYNAWARATYARLARGSVTRKKAAIVALARRLLVRLWAMLRDGAHWRADPVPAGP